MLSKEQLFTGVPVDTKGEGIPADANAVNRYALDDITFDTTMVREGNLDYPELAEAHQEYLDKAENDILWETDESKAATNQMDLLFMLGTYLPAGTSYTQVPPKLLGLIEQNASRFGLPRRMTYELIIDHNFREFMRTGQIRTFFDGDQGLHERDFYIGHALSEPYIQSAQGMVVSVLRDGKHVDTTRMMEGARQATDEFSAYMLRYNHYPTDYFKDLRQYLASYPEGVRNASGAFMPGVQLMELALHAGSRDYPKYAEFLNESMPYFPRRSQAQIAELMIASESGFNVWDQLVAGNIQLPEEARQGLIGVVGDLLQFRLRHLAITKKQTHDPTKPDEEQEITITGRRLLAEFGERDIMDPTKPLASGGFTAQTVLGNAVYRMIVLKERLAA